MRAVRLHGVGQLRVEDIPGPGPTPAKHVRIRIRAAGICGSDLHNFCSGRWLSRLPVIPGHELAGEVVEVGAGVSGRAPGELVVADSRVSCGSCRACKEGRENVCERLGYLGEVCDGGFAEFATLPSARVLPVPPGVPSRVAVLSEPLGVALHLIRRLAPLPGCPIIIAGAGPVGGLAAILLNHLGYGPLLVIERNVDRAALVSRLARAQIVAADVEAIGAAVAPSGLRYAIEASGSAALLSLLTKIMTGGGRLALVGLFHGECTLDFNLLVEREVDVLGCSVFRDEQTEALKLLPALRETLEQVTSRPVDLEDVPAEYTRLLAGQTSVLKSIVCP